ncbi:hypothetical protein TNCV_2682851 [Trichonephila clavipes]|nr:hypothetical protein TNCV_2682851 [Trichonephila clavipes]
MHQTMYRARCTNISLAWFHNNLTRLGHDWKSHACCATLMLRRRAMRDIHQDIIHTVIDSVPSAVALCIILVILQLTELKLLFI